MTAAPETAAARWGRLTADARPELVAAYQGWAKANPHVVETFLSLAQQMKAAGRDRYSGWAIVAKMRWDHDLTTKGDVFKIRNDFIGMMARHSVARDPSLEHFFEMRQMGRHGNVPEAGLDSPDQEAA